MKLSMKGEEKKWPLNRGDGMYNFDSISYYT
jgi:hypothetical protein